MGRGGEEWAVSPGQARRRVSEAAHKRQEQPQSCFSFLARVTGRSFSDPKICFNKHFLKRCGVSKHWRCEDLSDTATQSVGGGGGGGGVHAGGWGGGTSIVKKSACIILNICTTHNGDYAPFRRGGGALLTRSLETLHLLQSSTCYCSC